MPWKFGAATDIGGRQEQQDRLSIFKSRDGRRFLIAIADGMGGLHNGAQAAQAVIDTAERKFRQNDIVCDPQTFLEHICYAAHNAINDLQNGDGTAGTTIALLYIDNREAHWAHIGDTRVYHFRSGRLLTQTNDHSLLQIMTEKGMVAPGSGAAKSLQNQLYKRLGGERLPEPELASTEIEDGDLFLLCSDGFWQAVKPEQVMTALERYPLGGGCEEHLVALARRNGGEHCDNISLAMIQWTESSVKKIFSRFLGLITYS
jgi:serine/threonine protein phosphatase PrpC